MAVLLVSCDAATLMSGRGHAGVVAVGRVFVLQFDSGLGFIFTTITGLGLVRTLVLLFLLFL